MKLNDNILYIAGVSTEKTFTQLCETKIVRDLPQAQKYHRLLLEGLREHISSKLYVLSAYPTNRKWSKKFYFKKRKETFNQTDYHYLPFFNFPVVRQAGLFFGSFIKTFTYLCINRNTYIICDLLTSSITLGARMASRLYKKPCIAIVTDVPSYRAGAILKMYSSFNRYIKSYLSNYKAKRMYSFDGYILLTQAMNDVVNKKNKPYIVLEGHCDSNMRDINNTLDTKAKQRIILYTGGIHEEYGIRIMIDAFLQCNHNDWELHICGDGNYKTQLTELTKENKCIKYHGLVPNKVAVDMQLAATILINPRLTNAEYVKYSFPSKTLEYMASGTPVITTNLPSMPEEYKQYVYIAYDESVDGFKNVLQEVMTMDRHVLHHKGTQAKKFVLENKNNVSQARKIIDFIMNEFH